MEGSSTPPVEDSSTLLVEDSYTPLLEGSSSLPLEDSSTLLLEDSSTRRPCIASHDVAAASAGKFRKTIAEHILQVLFKIEYNLNAFRRIVGGALFGPRPGNSFSICLPPRFLQWKTLLLLKCKTLLLLQWKAPRLLYWKTPRLF